VVNVGTGELVAEWGLEECFVLPAGHREGQGLHRPGLDGGVQEAGRHPLEVVFVGVQRDLIGGAAGAGVDETAPGQS
jgi:hypothetical protein